MAMMTEDDAHGWLRNYQIDFPVKPSPYPSDPGWRFTLIKRSGDPGLLKITVPEKSALALLRTICGGAWIKYPTRKSRALADRIWRFFSPEQLRELYSLLLDDSVQGETER
ncbi:MAG: hypothetical protein ACLQBA_07895 [Candidatus Binataceae bacterium]